MTPLHGDHDYYKQMLKLQERLRKSEEERIRLEERFSILMQGSRSRHEACINKLRMRYIEFLEEQRGREERNQKLLGALDKVDGKLALMTAKTDRLGVLRKQYEAYLLRVYTNRGTGDSGIGSQNEAIPLRSDIRSNPILQTGNNANPTLTSQPGHSIDPRTSPQSQIYLQPNSISQYQNASIRQPHSTQSSPYIQERLQPRGAQNLTYVPQENLPFNSHELIRPLKTYSQPTPSYISQENNQALAQFPQSHLSRPLSSRSHDNSNVNITPTTYVPQENLPFNSHELIRPLKTYSQPTPSCISQENNQTLAQFPQSHLSRPLSSRSHDNSNVNLTPTTYVPQENLPFNSHELIRPLETYSQPTPSYISQENNQTLAQFPQSHLSRPLSSRSHDNSNVNLTPTTYVPQENLPFNSHELIRPLETHSQPTPSYISQENNQTFAQFPQSHLSRPLSSGSHDNSNVHLRNAPGDAQLPTGRPLPEAPFAEFRGVLPDNGSFRAYGQSTPLPGYLDYSTRYSRELDDVSQGFTRTDLEQLLRRNEPILPRDYLHNPETLKPTAEPSKSDKAGSRSTKAVENELDQYMSKIRNLHRDLDLQSLEEADADVEQNTSGDLLNVTLSEDEPEQLPAEAKTKGTGKIGTGCSEDVKEVLALADDLVSRTADVPESRGLTGNVGAGPRNVAEVRNVSPLSGRHVSSVHDKQEDGENRAADAGMAKLRENINGAAGLSENRFVDERNLMVAGDDENVLGSRAQDVGAEGKDVLSAERFGMKGKYGEAEKLEELEDIEGNDVKLVGREREESEEQVLEVVKEFQSPNLRHYERKVQEVFGDAGKSEMLGIVRDNLNADEIGTVEPLTEKFGQQERIVHQKGEGLGVDEAQNGKDSHADDDFAQGEKIAEDEREAIQARLDDSKQDYDSKELYDKNQQDSNDRLGHEPMQQYEHDPNEKYGAEPSEQYQSNPNEKYLAESSEQYRSDPNEKYLAESSEQYQSDPNEKYLAEPSEQYQQDPNEKYLAEPSEQYQQDPNEKYLAEPSEQYQQDPNEKYLAEPSEQYQQDPNEKYLAEPSGQYRQDPDGQYPVDSTQHYEQYSNPQHEYNLNQGNEQDPKQQNESYEADQNQQYAQDPNQQYEYDLNQQYEYDPNQQYQEAPYQDPNRQYENNQSYDYDADHYEQDPNQLAEHSQDQLRNQDPNQQYHYEQDPNQLAEHSQEQLLNQDPSQQYHYEQDPNQLAEHSQEQLLNQDPSQQYHYEQDPNQLAKHNQEQLRNQDPNQQYNYEQDPNQLAEHSQEQLHNQDPSQQYHYEQDPNQLAEHSQEQLLNQDPSQQYHYEQDPNQLAEHSQKQLRNQDPSQQYHYEQDPNQLAEHSQEQLRNQDPSQQYHYEQDPNQLTEHSQEQLLNQDPSQQYHYEQDPNQLAEHSQDQLLNQDPSYDPNQQYHEGTNIEDYPDEQQYGTDGSQYYQNPYDQNYDADNDHALDQQGENYRAENEVASSKIDISEDATCQPQLVESPGTEEQIVDPDEGRKRNKDVIKAILDSDTESTIERNISNNTESEFDFN